MALSTPNVLIGKVRPEANTAVQALVIDANQVFGTLQIKVVNDGGSEDATIKIAVSEATSAGSIQLVDYIETGDKIKPHGSVDIFGFVVKGGERVWVMSSNAHTNFRVTALAHTAA